MKVINGPEEKLDPIGLVFVIIVCGILSLYLGGCGYALVPIEEGVRTTITTERKLDQTFETAIETAIDPVSLVKDKLYRRR